MKLEEILPESDFKVLDAAKAVQTLRREKIKAFIGPPINKGGKKIQKIAVAPSDAQRAKKILIAAGNYFDPDMK